MNFLAHIYLSGDSEDLLIGNFIADFVKGKQYEQFVGSIQKGIFLHRQIDYFTDTHALVRQSTKRLQPD
jgi:acyl carrier protein phosphodiesterase